MSVLPSVAHIQCPDSHYILINGAKCCGVDANGPTSVPGYVEVPWNGIPEKTVILHITVQAGFPKNADQELATPTCYETMEFYDLNGGFPGLGGGIIPQNFFERDSFGRLAPTGADDCPRREGLPKTANPYNPKDVDPSKQSNNAGAEDSNVQPIGSFPWMRSPDSVANANEDPNNKAGPVANANNVDPNNVAGINLPANLINPSSSGPAKLSSSDLPPLWPGETASTLGADLNAAGFGGNVASFMQWNNPSTSKRGMPVEFRA
ncbi:hypothetical protein MMC07_004028 [Pseudocyphellaria aurata]|nr:hypothetical protein [Pseudocyphellaria aurata]